MSALAWLCSLATFGVVFTFLVFPAFIYARSAAARRERRAAMRAGSASPIERALEEHSASPLEDALLAPLMLLYFPVFHLKRLLSKGRAGSDDARGRS